MNKAVTERNSVEFPGDTTCLPNAFLHFFGQRFEVDVAWMHLVPGVGNTNEWLFKIIIGQSQRAQVGAMTGPVGATDDGFASCRFGDFEIVPVHGLLYSPYHWTTLHPGAR